MKHMRHTTGLTKWEQQSNEDIWNLLKIKSILQQTLKFKCKKHVNIMTEIEQENNPPWERGRPAKDVTDYMMD